MEGARSIEAQPRVQVRAMSLPALLRRHWPVILVVGVTLVAGLPTLNYPYGPDQALFAYMGDRLAHGAGLYVDVWDVKPPGIFWIYGAIELLPGPQFRVLRMADLLYTGLSVAALYALGLLYWDRIAGAVAGLLYGTVYLVATGYWHSAQPDSFMVLPMVLGLFTYEQARRRNGTTPALISGLLFGFAAELRPMVLLLPALLAVLDLSASVHGTGTTRQRLQPAMRRVALLIAGGVAVEVLTLLWLGLHGAIGEYLYAQFDFASEYARQGGPYSPDGLTVANYLSGLRSGTMFIVFARLLLVAPALTAVIVGGVIRRERLVIETSLLALVAYLGVAIQAKYFLYHWHSVLPLLALLSGWTASFLWRSLRDSGRGWGAAAATAGGIGAVLLLLTPNVSDRAVTEWQAFTTYWTDPDSRSTYYDRFGLYGRGSFSYKASEEVSHYVAERTNPNDTIFVWGYDPLVYVLSDRESSSRFTSFLPLMSLWTPQRWVDEFVDDIERRRPAYIILQRNENARWITGHWIDPVDFVRLLPRFEAVLQNDYELETQIEDYTLYRRRAP
ncbi:MAG: ArnT family glycosyltransferase [Dehalococcoidia bacterium]